MLLGQLDPNLSFARGCLHVEVQQSDLDYICELTSMHSWVQRLDTAAEHFWCASNFRNISCKIIESALRCFCATTLNWTDLMVRPDSRMAFAVPPEPTRANPLSTRPRARSSKPVLSETLSSAAHSSAQSSSCCCTVRLPIGLLLLVPFEVIVLYERALPDLH